MANVKQRMGDRIDFAENPYQALQGADALLICTEWQLFRTPDFAQMKQGLNNPIIFDGRNLYDVQEMQDLGWEYTSIGRPSTATS